MNKGLTNTEIKTFQDLLLKSNLAQLLALLRELETEINKRSQTINQLLQSNKPTK